MGDGWTAKLRGLRTCRGRGGAAWRKGPLCQEERKVVAGVRVGAPSPSPAVGGGPVFYIGGNGTGLTPCIQPVPFLEFLFCSFWRR